MAAPVSSPAADARAAFIASVLEEHNKLRAMHGAPPLQWSDDCEQSARAAAEHCHTVNRLEHTHCESTTKRGVSHGQNLFFRSPPMRTDAAISAAGAQAWYKEKDSPGYDFAAGDIKQQPGTGHFTALVWKSASHCGAALSSCRCYLAVNYFPVTNMRGKYVENVLRPKS